MALDGPTYDRVEEAEEKILNNIGKKLDPPINDIESAIKDFKEIARSLPSGVPAPSLSSISSSSNEEGIDVTLTANVKSYEQSNESFVLSRTDGVMVRYKEDSFPVNKEDGTLAFIDTDLFTVGSNGEITPKQKTNRVVGLTNGKTYCFTAFPYSTQNVYNESAGSKNCTKCQWTGTKGTLTVNVTQDHDYKPLGEYTATLTPTAGGSAVTKTQTNAGTIVFSGLEAGQYTLSFSAPKYFKAPQSQSVNVVAGQSKSINCEYVFSVKLNDLSWEEIDSFAEQGIAPEIFSVHDTKSYVAGPYNITVQIAGFNQDYLSGSTSAERAKISFLTNDIYITDKKQMHASNNSGLAFFETDLCNWLNGDFYNSFPSDLKSVIKTTYKWWDRQYTSGTDTSKGGWGGVKIWVPRIGELNTSYGSSNMTFKYISNTEYYMGLRCYPAFTSASLPRYKLNGVTTTYWTSSRTKEFGSEAISRSSFLAVPDTNYNNYEPEYMNSSLGVIFGFCI